MVQKSIKKFLRCGVYWLFLFSVFVFSCREKKDTAFEPIDDPTPQKFENADITLDNFSIEQLSQTQSQWSLNAKRAYVFYGKKETFVEQVDVLYHTSARESTRVQSDLAIYNENQQQIVLKKNVTVKTSNGRSLTTEELIWDDKKKKILTDKAVTIRYSNGDTIYGQNGLRADQNLERVELFSGRGVHNSGSLP